MQQISYAGGLSVAHAARRTISLLDEMRDWVARKREWVKPKQVLPNLAVKVIPPGSHKCALCNGVIRCDIPAPMMVMNDDVICRKCGREHAPILDRALEDFRINWVDRTGYSWFDPGPVYEDELNNAAVNDVPF